MAAAKKALSLRQLHEKNAVRMRPSDSRRIRSKSAQSGGLHQLASHLAVAREQASPAAYHPSTDPGRSSDRVVGNRRNELIAQGDGQSLHLRRFGRCVGIPDRLNNVEWAWACPPTTVGNCSTYRPSGRSNICRAEPCSLIHKPADAVRSHGRIHRKIRGF